MLKKYILLLTLLGAIGANAATIGFELTLIGSGTPGASSDRPIFTLENLSTVSVYDIIGFNFTIGNTAYNFDFADLAVAQSGSFTFENNRPGTTGNTNGQNGNPAGRFDDIDFTFSGFGPGEIFAFRPELDPDFFNSGVNFRTIFFNNGAAVPGSHITVSFKDGSVLTEDLGDSLTPGASTYTFAQTFVVPEPRYLSLIGGGLIALGLLRRRYPRG